MLNSTFSPGHVLIHSILPAYWLNPRLTSSPAGRAVHPYPPTASSSGFLAVNRACLRGRPSSEAHRILFPRGIARHECSHDAVDIHSTAMHNAVMLKKELIAASTEPLLLSILAQGENYGYGLIQKVRESSGGQISWTDGMLYPVLHRLERQGLIKSRWKTSDTGRNASTIRSRTKDASRSTRHKNNGELSPKP